MRVKNQMKKTVSLFLFMAAFAFGAVVNPSQSSMVILLDDSGLCDSSSGTWKNIQVGVFLKDHAFYGKSNSIYCRSYNGSMSPSEAADSLFRGANTVFQDALTEWEKGENASNFVNRPNKFVIIAEGVAGLAVREYIQSKDYQGEIDNVIFFNTPHEGAGFADQYLLNKTSALKKSTTPSDYSEIIPLALAAYLVGGEVLEDLMMKLLKEAVLGMAQNPQKIKKNFNTFFDGGDESYKSLMYLAQDLDVEDKAYNEVKEAAQKKGLVLKDYAGSTQLLNSYSMLNSYDHPAYNTVYSYGLPTIGNGRRTLDDFADQPKNHVSKEKLQKVLTESVSTTLRKNGKQFENDLVKDVVSRAMSGDYASNAMQAASSIASELNIPVGQISGYVQDISTLSKLKFNKENLPQSVLKVISIANKYLPEEFKSELYSTFIDKYSDALSMFDSTKGDAKKGLALIANNLSNYSINFFDEGTFNVPAASAMGNHVQAFKESGVFRKGYSLKEHVEKDQVTYTRLNNYLGLVSEAGRKESLRQDIDEGLKVGCAAIGAVASPAATEVCRIGQFMANVALIADISSTIEDAVENVGALKELRYVAVTKSMEQKEKFWNDHNGEEQSIEVSDMESMIFGPPLVSLQTVRKSGSGVDTIVPLALYTTFESVKSYADIYRDSATYGYLFPTTEFAEINRSALTNSTAVMVKDVQYEQRNGFLHKDVRYAALDGFTVRDFIREYRFIIDDFQPDELRLIKFDFNARMQIAYERDGSTWKIYRATANQWEPNPIDILTESPVQKDGSFVFRPKDIINRGNTKDSILLSALYEDGANTVTIHVENKVGYANTQRIKFRFQAVDYIIDESWPMSFETVSRMDTVDIFANDWGYGASLGQYRLIVTSEKTTDTVSVFADSVSGAGAGASYRFWADLTPVWKKHPFETTTYTLKWDLGFKVKTLKADNTVGEQDIYYNPQVIVRGDTSAPNLMFDTNYVPEVVSLNNDVALAYVINTDSVDNRALRGMRSFIVRKSTGEKVILFNKAHVTEPSYEIKGRGSPVSWSDSVDLYVQAYDFANPDTVTKRKLLSVVADAAKSSWDSVMVNDTAFKTGINGISIHKVILVDNEAPQVSKESIAVNSSVDGTLPSFTKHKNGNEVLLNGMDTLLVSFDIGENLLGRDSESVRVELVFEDSLGVNNNKQKRYLAEFIVTGSTKRFVFDEPDANRLRDGIYSLTVTLIDEAGNKSSKRIAENLRVDRTRPDVRGISLSDVFVTSVAKIENGTAHIVQFDDARNRSDLACYVKVNVDTKEGKWKGPIAETESKAGVSVNYKFDVKGATSDTSHGYWYVYFGCYDDAGNFGKNMSFIGVGARYPEITYPRSGSERYNNRVLVRGIAPNPNDEWGDNHGEFSVSWKKEGTSTWSDSGITYLVYDRSLSPSARDLAVWEMSGLNLTEGNYVLRLSVRQCDTCEWLSNESTVFVDEFTAGDSPDAPKLKVTPPVDKQVAGHVEDVSIELLNVPDTSEWLVKASIEAPSPKDSSVYMRVMEKTFDPMTLSPFKTPAVTSDTGLSIWQEDDGITWHVRYAGKAKGVKVVADTTGLRRPPYLAIRHIDTTFTWKTFVEPDSVVHLGFIMDSIRIKREDINILVPRYNTTQMWKVGADSVHLIFETTSPFAVDASWIDSASYRDTLSPVVYIFPETYKAHVAWNGLVNGAYSSGSLVKVNVVAYEKGNEKNIISKGEQWYLKYEKTGIEFSLNNLDKYYMDFLGPNEDSSGTKMADYGFRFKLTGRSAYVTAEIIDSDNNSVRTLMKDSLVIATSANQWKTLQWNGEGDDHFVHAGLYKMHFLVKNDTGIVVDTCYPFEVSLGANIIAAKPDSTGRKVNFKMAEAFLDTNGEYRYVGRPDYILKTKVSGTVLPEDERTIDYTWDVYGLQHPYMYKRTRPALGIRRHRDGFWATVVTMVLAEGYFYNGHYIEGSIRTTCDEPREAFKYQYKIQLQRVYFKKGETVSDIIVDMDPGNYDRTNRFMYGARWNAFTGRLSRLPALVAIKVYPASSFEQIRSLMGDQMSVVGNAIDDANKGHIDNFPWDSVYLKKSYSNNNTVNRMRDWFGNWGGEPLYYEAVNNKFNVGIFTNTLTNAFDMMSSTKTFCVVDQPKDTVLTDNDVCGAEKAIEEVDTTVIKRFNPHAYMMNVELIPADGKTYTKLQSTEEHCAYVGGTDIRMRFVLDIDSSYWEPEWGTNNLANRYVRFDPMNKTLYGEDGYMYKLAMRENNPIPTSYNGSEWVPDGSLNHGPTVFEARQLPILNIPENPLLFNDELGITKPKTETTGPEVVYYTSQYSWRYYLGKGDVIYKAVARNLAGTILSTFSSNDSSAREGKDVNIGSWMAPYDIVFEIAPSMTFDKAQSAGLIMQVDKAVDYPWDGNNCAVDTPPSYHFYGCDKWVSKVHSNFHDWNDSLWKSKFALSNGKGYIRNPVTDGEVIRNPLAEIETPRDIANANEKIHDSVTAENWNEATGAWEFNLSIPDADKDDFLAGISASKYNLKLNGGSGWDTVTLGNVIRIYNYGTQDTSFISFYRSRDAVFNSDTGLNNGQRSEEIPLRRVVSQSSNPGDTILSTEWAKNLLIDSIGIFKRNMHGDTALTPHPYLDASYDSLNKEFDVTRNSNDIYASREDEIITLYGSVPYDISEWTISYVQNGMRFKVADGTSRDSIKASMNVNQLQGNTSFFLTYRGASDVISYQQLNVHIGERVEAGKESFVYSMYGNVFIHFDQGAWERDEDVTVRTMDPSECGECALFRNMVPVGPVLEVLPSHKFPEGAEPTVTVDISMATLKSENVDYKNLKIYKVNAEKDSIIPLDNLGGLKLLDSSGDSCKAQDPYSCAFVRIIAKTPTFSKFVILDSLKADDIEIIDSIPEIIEEFSCSQMDSIWLDTLWMGTANGWLEYPYLCSGKSNYLLQLNNAGNVSAEHRGASAMPIVWPVRNTDLYVLDSAYQSSIVFYGVDGNTEQKLGPVVRLDSIAPVIENVETTVSENEDGARVIHVEAEINEVGGGMAYTTAELFLGGTLLQSKSIIGDRLPTFDFILSKKDLYGCVGCQSTIKVIAQDKGHNFDMVVKQTEKQYPYPLSLVLWYPFAEGTGDIAHELLTKDDGKRMHMNLATLSNPWQQFYGVSLFKQADSARSPNALEPLDSLRPFTFEFNIRAGYIQNSVWSILSFVVKNEWTFGIGLGSRYFLKVGSSVFYFNTKREGKIPVHLTVVVDGVNVSLYKNGQYEESIKLDHELLYGGGGKLQIGARDGLPSAVGEISNLRFYSSALSADQIQDIFNGVVSEETVNFEAVRVVTLTDREGLIVDQSCSAPGKAYLRQKNADNSGIMTWKTDVNADNYSLYILHRNYVSEESKVEISVNGASVGIFKLSSTGYWKSEKVTGVNLGLKAGINEISIRPLGNLGVVALALASTSANIDERQIGYNESSWTNPDPKAKVLMKYESVDDKKWAQVRFDVRNITDHALENMRLRYYYKGEGESVNAVSFYPGSPMSVINDAGSVFYAEFAFTEPIAAYGKAYYGQGPLIGLHRLTAPNNYFPYWDKTDDPSYLQGAETEYVNATGIALLDGEGNLLNEFSCYDEDGPMQKAKIKVRAMARDNSYGSSSVSDIVAYVENIGNVAVDGFEMRYYFRDTAKTEMDIHWNAFATSSKVNAGGDLYYASFKYDVILNSGDKTDYGSGVQFALHHPNRTNDFNVADDPSHYNLNNYEMVEADSIVVLDSRGNLLWGNAPQPRFSADYVTKETYAELVHREGDVIYVDIEENGYYILETVNAVGIPLKTLYRGTWDIGEHSVTIDMNSLQPSSFIVLRRGSEILSWGLLN